MPVINGVYLKDFTALPGAVADANIIPIAITGDQVAYRTTVAGIVTDARITAKLLTGLSVTGGAVVAADTILAAFGKVQNQINGKQGTITLTTTGTSGAATFSANTLNIPQYADAYVGTVTSVAALTLGTTGTDLSSTVANGTTTPVITLQVPTASASNRGALSSADWSTFNNKAAALSGTINTIAYWDSATTIASLALATYPSLTELSYVKGVTSAIQTQLNAKQATITLTTTGTSGAATFSANTLNIPQYQAAGTYVTSVTGTSPIVSSGGTTPAISIPVATTSVNGYLSSTDWTTFNNKQATITLTTTGTSGAATLVGSTLNVPNYADGGVLSLSAIGGTANANAATITGTVLNLQPASASFGGVVTTGTQTFAGNKTFNNDIYVIGGAQVYGLSAIGEYDGGGQIPPAYGGNYALTLGSGLTSNGLSLYTTGKGYFVGQLRLDSTITNGTYTYTLPSATGTIALVGGAGVGTVTSVAAITLGTSGTDLSSTVANSTTTPVITLNVPTASATNRGALSSADWTTFNNKQSALTNPVTGTGTTNYLPKFTGASTIGDSAITDVSGIIKIGTTASTTYGTLTIVQQSVAAPSFVRGIQLVHPNGTGVTGGYIGISVSGQKQGQIQVGDDSNSGDLIINPAGGNVGIGTTSPSYQLQLSTDSAAKPSTNTWTISSDSRVKENITPYTKGLSAIMAINPVNYDYNGKAGFSVIKGNIGLIAQDVLEILPESVSTYKTKLEESDAEDTELYNFNSHALTYILINAIKELKAEIDLLKGIAPIEPEPIEEVEPIVEQIVPEVTPQTEPESEPIIPTDNNLE